MKLGQKFWTRPPEKFGVRETSKFGPNFGQLRDNLMANISGTKQDIVERKTVSQTADSPVYAYLIG